MKILLFVSVVFLGATYAQLECGKPTVPFGESVSFKKKPAILGNFPWLAELCQYDSNFEKCEHKCAATIIDEEWVLTAAKCITTENSFNSYFLRFGSLTAEKGYTEERRVDRVAKWTLGRRLEDMVLIKIAGGPLEFNKRIQKICIPKMGETEVASLATPGKYGLVAGWGATKGVEKPADIVQQLKVPFRRSEDCTKVYQGVSKKTLCAGLSRQGSGYCFGDSGNPLMVKNSEGRYYQVGIASHGDRCNTEKVPGLYQMTDCDWLKHHVKKEVCVPFEPETDY